MQPKIAPIMSLKLYATLVPQHVRGMKHMWSPCLAKIHALNSWNGKKDSWRQEKNAVLIQVHQIWIDKLQGHSNASRRWQRYKFLLIHLSNHHECLSFSADSANNTILANQAMKLCQHLPDEGTAKNISIKDIEIPMDMTEPPPNDVVDGTSITVLKPQINTTTKSPGASPTIKTTMSSGIMKGNMTTEAPCCRASSLSTMAHIFITSLFLGSLPI